ncbi:MAG: hypothetical protein IPP94_13635 [Ignavibacteria bacterium]|nr:hypothetical protein [Ignavibacteria bacterium]
MLAPYGKDLAMLGLGGSVATPVGGIEAEAFVVGSFEELSPCGRGGRKIVVYDVPFTTPGETVTAYRWRGAMDAARAGAVASLVRSVTPISLNTPHTGSMGYADSLRKIPHHHHAGDAEALPACRNSARRRSSACRWKHRGPSGCSFAEHPPKSAVARRRTKW